MQKQYKLTKERLEELKAELEHLKTVREHEVAELIKEARGFGDLSENSEYDEAKNDIGFNDFLRTIHIIKCQHCSACCRKFHHFCLIFSCPVSQRIAIPSLTR